MKIEQTPLDGNKVKLHVEITPEEREEATDKGVQAFLLAVGAPSPEGTEVDTLLCQIIGEEGDMDGAKLDFAVNYLVPRAVEQSGIIPVCSPEFSHPEVPEAAQSTAFDVTIVAKPEFELSSYDPVSIVIDKPTVTDEEVEEQINALAERMATTETDIMTAEPKTVIPEITDEWVAKNISDDKCNTVEELRTHMREAGFRYKASQFEQDKLNMAVDEMAKRLEAEVPQDILEAMADSMMKELSQQMAQQQKTLQQMAEEEGITLDQLRDQIKDQAKEMLRQGFTLDAYFRHAGMAIDEHDIQRAIHAIAPGQEEEALESMKDSGYMFTVEETAQRLKAGIDILDKADITVRG